MPIDSLTVMLALRLAYGIVWSSKCQAQFFKIPIDGLTVMLGLRHRVAIDYGNLLGCAEIIF